MSWTISVKGVLQWGGQVVLLHNERGEWELPGGQVEPTDPTPEAALARELAEELGIRAEVGELLCAYRYDPLPDRPVLIVAYRCDAERPDVLWHSNEHDRVGLFDVDQLHEIALPDGYRQAIERA
ncbi:MAG: NUDIX domain-containing protein [Acidimicrobiales bacterium]